MSRGSTQIEPTEASRGPAGVRASPPSRAARESVGPPAQPATAARRRALSRAIVELLRAAIVDPGAIDILLDEGSAAGETAEDATGLATSTAATAMTGSGRRATVIIRGPDALGRLIFPPSPDGFAEGFLRGDLDIEGDVVAAVDAGQALDLRRLGASKARRLARWGWELRRGTPGAVPLQRASRMVGKLHSPARDMAAVRFHYDVGNAFYRLWLDRRLTYSCAYFPDGTVAEDAADLLDEAQEAKLDLIAGKLRLVPGTRLIDIGCGWGSLINFVGERHGCEAVGVTLSEQQADEANARARAAGLGARVRAEVRDYRDLAELGLVDAIASVGMVEHVGRVNMPSYFRAAYAALRPGGLFLNHGIAQAGVPGRSPGPDLRPRRSQFVDRYVFPDGELIPVEETIRLARAAGFGVIDVQSLRPHYALTLAAWTARLEAGWTTAIAVAGDEVARTWRLYMSAARRGFERGDLDVFQLLLAKPAEDGPAELPLRPWW